MDVEFIMVVMRVRFCIPVITVDSLYSIACKGILLPVIII